MRFICWITKPRIQTHNRNVQYLVVFHVDSGYLKVLRVTLPVLFFMTSPSQMGFLIITLVLHYISQITILSRPLSVSIILRVVNTTVNPGPPKEPFGAGIIFLNFSTPCILNVNNTGTKQVSIMKQTAF